MNSSYQPSCFDSNIWADTRNGKVKKRSATAVETSRLSKPSQTASQMTNHVTSTPCENPSTAVGQQSMQQASSSNYLSSVMAYPSPPFNIGQIITNLGQTMSNFDQTTVNLGHAMGNFGQPIGNFRQVMSNFDHAMGSFGHAMGSFGHAASNVGYVGQTRGQTAGQKKPVGRPLVGSSGVFSVSKEPKTVSITFGLKQQTPVASLSSVIQLPGSDINRLAFIKPNDPARFPVFPVHNLGTSLAAGPRGISAIGPQAGQTTRSHYSRKVFVGGLPPDVTAQSLTDTFCKFGVLDVGWPRKTETMSLSPPKGFAFLQFQDEEAVHKLIKSCYRCNGNNSIGYYTRISSLTADNKEVQVRPWDLRDAERIFNAASINERNSVFVGGVPRPLTATQLADVMRSLFGPICASTIETDVELGYPKGSARVTFQHSASKIAAVSARFVQISLEDIKKRVEVKPFVLQDQPCDRCNGVNCSGAMAQFFCPNVACLKYLCPQCWACVHAVSPAYGFHKPLLQKSSDPDWRATESNEKPPLPW